MLSLWMGRSNGSNDGIGGLVFSPDGQRVAYTAKMGKKWFAVVAGQEGSQYHSIVAPPEGGGVIFDSPNQLHYMARKGNGFYLVEERFA